jgi:OOP family OmpA-OmpF porin
MHRPLLVIVMLAAFIGASPSSAATKYQRAPRWKNPDFESTSRGEVVDGRIPDADTDGDSVADRLDLCPDTPRGAKVDDYGCPWDSDGDGVPDGLDQCPSTPAGSSVDADGCDAMQRGARGQTGGPAPESRAVTPAPTQMPPTSGPHTEFEKKLLANGEIRLENVYFETGSAVLLPESETTLSEAGHTLEHFSALKIEVQGHTDSRGSSAYNQRLSQARAESVRSYLLQHFMLKPDKLVAKGYGESRLEVKEKNDEDRQRNRRVVLKVLNPDALPRGVEVKD